MRTMKKSIIGNWNRKNSKYTPHQGKKEKARRVKNATR